MRMQRPALAISLALLTSLFVVNSSLAAPIVDLKSKSELKLKGPDSSGKLIKKKKPSIGKVKFEKNPTGKDGNVKKKTKFSFEESDKLPKLKIKGKSKFDKGKLDKSKPFVKKKKFDIFDKKSDRKLTSFALPIEVELDLTRGGLISGFRLEEAMPPAGIQILQSSFLGFSAASVPEPRTALLLGLGMFGLVWVGYARDKGTQAADHS